MSMYIILMLWFVCSLRRWSTPSWQPCPWGPSRLQAASPSQTPSTANSRSYPPYPFNIQIAYVDMHSTLLFFITGFQVLKHVHSFCHPRDSCLCTRCFFCSILP